LPPVFWGAGWKVEGKAKLEAYFQRGWKPIGTPLRLEDVLWGINSIVLYYTKSKGNSTGEFMELSASGKVVRVVANYSSRLGTA